MANVDLKEWLIVQHEVIMDHERKALDHLAAGDKKGYEQEMALKARALADLSAAKTFAGTIPAGVSDTLKRFSASAANALNLGSSFYMSALLYNDDQKPDEPDNLLRLIQSL